MKAMLVTLIALLATLLAHPATAAELRAELQRVPVVVTAGDSITWGGAPWDRQRVPYPAALRNIGGDGIQVRNMGHPGACLLYEGCQGYETLMRETLRRDVWPKRPDVVTVSIGANDLGARLPTADLKREYRAIRRDGARHGVKVLLATITPGRNFWPADCEAQRQELNDWIRTLPHVDFDQALDNGVGEMRGRFDSGDGIHPSTPGYKRMAREAWRTLAG
jgi:lysophospholipase L1-like esterase